MRVVLIGAECTGKTTLARRLAARYGTVWAPEYARLFVDEVGRPVRATDVEVIARGVLRTLTDAAARADGLLVADTDLVSTVVYSRYYYGGCPDWIVAAAAEREADLYLFTQPDLPWEPDADQRDGPAAREAQHALFAAELARRQVRVAPVGGPPADRLAAATAAVDRLLRDGHDAHAA